MTALARNGLRHASGLLTRPLTSLVTAAGAVAILSQVRRTSGSRSIAVIQTLTPHLTLAMVPIALGALRRGRATGALAAAVGAGGAAIVVPVLARSVRSDEDPLFGARGGGAVRIATVNLLYTNDRSAAIADDLLDRSLDVIVFTEYTTEHRARLDAHALADRFPHRVDREGPRALGLAIWSRRPLAENVRIATVNNSIDVTLDTDGGEIRVIGVHTPTPVEDFAGWEQDLATIRRAARHRVGPTLVIGDFNATYWHPPFRGILAEGYDDAHVALGRGMSSTWPVGGWVRPFALLDHALIGPGLDATAIASFPVAGSDHRAVVVTVAAAR